MRGALEDITVLDLTHVLAGPFCTYQLGLLGADIIKIENPHDPDCARGRGPDDALNAKGLGLTYQVQGGNKRSLALDLTQAKGRDILLSLARSADVVVENYATGALEKLGLGYGDLAKVNPALVHCSITGFGDAGPKAMHGAYDNTIQALSGVIAQCAGQKPGVSFVDYATGYAAAFAVSSALVQALRAGQGTHISVSMLEVAMQMMAPEAAAAQLTDGQTRAKEAGISSYETRDGVILLGAFKPAQYRKLGVVLDTLGQPVPDLKEITDWAEIWAKSDMLRVALAKIFKTQSTDHWIDVLRAADVPAEPVQSLAEAVLSPQLAARGYFQKAPDGSGPLLPVSAFQMTLGGARLEKAPPALGAATREILSGLNVAEAEIEELFNERVVA